MTPHQWIIGSFRDYLLDSGTQPRAHRAEEPTVRRLVRMDPINLSHLAARGEEKYAGVAAPSP